MKTWSWLESKLEDPEFRRAFELEASAARDTRVQELEAELTRLTTNREILAADEVLDLDRLEKGVAVGVWGDEVALVRCGPLRTLVKRLRYAEALIAAHSLPPYEPTPENDT